MEKEQLKYKEMTNCGRLRNIGWLTAANEWFIIMTVSWLFMVINTITVMIVIVA